MSAEITVTDLFCGAGGSSIGAEKAGARLRMAANHWRMAIDTHNTNFPDTYVVLGNKRERVRQYGNAVTPPVMDGILRRCIESLAGEVAP